MLDPRGVPPSAPPLDPGCADRNPSPGAHPARRPSRASGCDATSNQKRRRADTSVGHSPTVETATTETGLHSIHSTSESRALANAGAGVGEVRRSGRVPARVYVTTCNSSTRTQVTWDPFHTNTLALPYADQRDRHGMQ